MNYSIRELRQDEKKVLDTFLYEAIFIPEGVPAPSKEIIHQPELEVYVKDFGEIIKVSEELFKPILYWESKESTEAWFSVMSNEITYRFIFRNNG